LTPVFIFYPLPYSAALGQRTLGVPEMLRL